MTLITLYNYLNVAVVLLSMQVQLLQVQFARPEN